MPVKSCTVDGGDGFKCGDEGTCYSVAEHGEQQAWRMACSQCRAMGAPCEE